MARKALGTELGYTIGVSLSEHDVDTDFEDVARNVEPVLRHRLILDYAARVDGQTTEAVIEALMEEVSPQSLQVPSTLEVSETR